MELSGNQTLVIRDAKQRGEANIAEYYPRFLRECFDYLDVDKTGLLKVSKIGKRARFFGSSPQDLVQD